MWRLRSDGGSGHMPDRWRQKRTAALRRLIEDVEASGISECRFEEVFAEARALSDERGRQGDAAVKGSSGMSSPRDQTGE